MIRSPNFTIISGIYLSLCDDLISFQLGETVNLAGGCGWGMGKTPDTGHIKLLFPSATEKDIFARFLLTDAKDKAMSPANAKISVTSSISGVAIAPIPC